MHRLSALAASVVVALLAAPAVADDKRDCLDHKDYDARIKSCSEIIRSNPSDAIAYHNRGIARGDNKELKGAIADYTKALELSPDYVPSYFNRGISRDPVRARETSQTGALRRSGAVGPSPLGSGALLLS